MPRRQPRDALKVLSNPKNRELLGLLAVEPSYPRRLADLVGLTENEVSIRLRQFQNLGLVEGSWANVGKNVRLYRLLKRTLTVPLAPGAGDEPILIGSAPIVGEAPPTVETFIGRAQELAKLETLLSDHVAVCIHGLGGTGKTILAARYAGLASRTPAWHRVLGGESAPILAARLARSLAAAVPPALRSRLLGLHTLDDVPLLLQIIAEVANERAALLVVDSLDNAEDDAVEAVAQLASSLTSGRLLVTGRAWLARLRSAVFGSIAVDGLPRADAAALLRSLGVHASDRTLQRVHERTGGHALRLVLVAAAYRHLGPGQAEDLLADVDVPRFLADDLLPRLAESERELLLCLAILNVPCDPADAEAVSGMRNARALCLRLSQAGLLTQVGDRFQLHDMLRNALRPLVPKPGDIHLRAAQHFLKSQEPSMALEGIHHFLEAGHATTAARTIRDEIDHRKFRFYELGLGPKYADVLRRLVDLPGVGAVDRAAVHLELAHLASAIGDVEQSRLHLSRATLHGQRLPGALQAWAKVAQARIERYGARYAAAENMYESALREAVPGPDAVPKLEILLEYATFVEERDAGRALKLYQEGLRLSTSITDLRLAALTYAGAARMAAQTGDPRLGDWADEGLRLARLTGSVRAEASVYTALSVRGAIRGRTPVDLANAQHYLELSQRIGDPWMRACALTDVALLLTAQGRPEDALRHAKQCLEIASQLRSPFYRIGAAILAAEALETLQRPAEAIDLLAGHLAKEPEEYPGILARGWKTMARLYGTTGNGKRAGMAAARVRGLASRARRDPSMGRLWVRLPSPGPTGRKPAVSRARASTPGTRRAAAASKRAS